MKMLFVVFSANDPTCKPKPQVVPLKRLRSHSPREKTQGALRWRRKMACLFAACLAPQVGCCCAEDRRARFASIIDFPHVAPRRAFYGAYGAGAETSYADAAFRRPAARSRVQPTLVRAPSLFFPLHRWTRGSAIQTAHSGAGARSSRKAPLRNSRICALTVLH